MIGTLLNTTAILAGGAIGLTVARDISAANQQRLKFLLGAFTIYAGFSMVWAAVGGSFGRVVKQLTIMLLALLLGNATGKLLGLQRAVSRLGEFAKERLATPTTANGSRFNDGFVTPTLLFCVGPMAILGALEDGLIGSIRTLAIKSVLDGLATMAFARTFGWSVLLSAVPVLAYQGTITLMAGGLQSWLADPIVLKSIGATGGMLVAFIALVVLEVKKVPLADYLPSLLYAPLLTAWWR